MKVFKGILLFSLVVIVGLVVFGIYDTFQGDVQCPRCGGDGKITEEYTGIEEYEVPVKYEVKENCRRCGRRGIIECDATYTYGGRCKGGSVYFYGNYGMECSQCNSAGTISCYSCDGYGYEEETKTRYETRTKEVRKTREISDGYCEGKGKVSKFGEMFKYA